MKKFLKKCVSFILCVSLTVPLASCGAGKPKDAELDANLLKKVTIRIGYNDAKLTDYFYDCAQRFHEAHTNVTVELVLIGTDDYLNTIYNKSIKENDVPDLFLMSSDNVKEAYLMGLLSENASYPEVYTTENYGTAALQATSFREKLYGYPLYFSTAVMVYNKRYIQKMNTFADITAYNDNFVHNEENAEVEEIIGWDISQIDLNYAFFGEYMQVGGDNYEDSDNIWLSDDKMLSCLTAFRNFEDVYGIARDSYTYEGCLTKFLEGKMIQTIIRTEDLKKINDSGLDYGIEPIPDFDGTLKARAYSTTYMLVVNPYSAEKKLAAEAAKQFTFDYVDRFYEKSSYAAARGGLQNNPNAEYDMLHNIYSNTKVKAKFKEIGDFYMQMEIMLHKILDGDVSAEDGYAAFKEYVKTIK